MDEQTRQADLIARAVAGDGASLAVLLTQTRAEVARRVARRIPARLRGGIDADDIVQEAYVEVFRHIASFENRGPDAFLRWATTIALRKLRDAIKARAADKRGGDRVACAPGADASDSVVALLDLMAVSERTPSRSAAGHEAEAAVASALKLLPDDYREAVGLVYIRGVSVAEAAATMGRTERAVHNLCYKAKMHLRDLLGGESRFFSSSG